MKESIRKFIIDTFMFREGALEDDQPLFDSGIIDSLGFIKLLAFIERELGIAIDMKEIAIDNFDTVNKIIQTLERKKQENNSGRGI